MRRGCPNSSAAVATLCWGWGLLALTGCSGGQQGGVPNPFLAADRVPPPATRAIPQGTAQPYYPTDAMPPFQGGATQPATPWNGAGQSDITPIPGNAFSASSTPAETTPRNTIAANEPSIAVPTDAADLRFAAVPRPVTQVDVAPLAGAGTTTLSGTLPPRSTTTLPPTAIGVTTTPAVASTPPGSASPQVSLTPVQNSAPPGTFREPAPAGVAPAGTEPEPMPSDIPRVRLPQGPAPGTQPVAMPADVRTMSYQIELPPVGGTAPTTAPALVPTVPAAPATYPAAPTPTASPASSAFGASPTGVVPAAYMSQVPQPPVTPDGFRPRGEARRRAEQGQSPTEAAPTVFASATLPSTGQQAYGYGASYEWLQGRLEYSAILGHWTLRYMPLGGATDSFGGTVPVAESHLLAGFRPGDFVIVQGQLVAAGADPSMPVAYSVYTIQRQ